MQNPQDGQWIFPGVCKCVCGRHICAGWGPGADGQQHRADFRRLPQDFRLLFYGSCVHPFDGTLPEESEGLPIRLGDTDYSQPAHPCLFLHSNLGITFDLQAFTSRLPGVEIAEFRSEIGISDTAERASSAVFWVLVDGQVRYRKDVQKRGPADIIRIPLEKTDRFLTLMTTDAGDLEPEWEDNPNGYDWCVWGKPILILK
ncbi:MAG TPA: NPCBM/NEW2 domain-containing protein [Anaerohalosphaeraceae bacterium]|nr:NPCBM/NEW2 domain-containing protein [Anaerohalosphaeraceae bacterium]